VDERIMDIITLVFVKCF